MSIREALGAPQHDVHTVLEWVSRRADGRRLAAGAAWGGSADLRLRIKRHGARVGASRREERSCHGLIWRIAQVVAAAGGNELQKPTRQLLLLPWQSTGHMISTSVACLYPAFSKNCLNTPAEVKLKTLG